MRKILTLTASLVALWWNDVDLEFRLEHCYATYINIIFSFAVAASENKIWQIMERRLPGLLQP